MSANCYVVFTISERTDPSISIDCPVLFAWSQVPTRSYRVVPFIDVASYDCTQEYATKEHRLPHPEKSVGSESADIPRALIFEIVHQSIICNEAA